MFNLTVDIDDIVAQFKPRSTHVVLGLGIVPNWKNLQIKKTSRAECPLSVPVNEESFRPSYLYKLRMKGYRRDTNTGAPPSSSLKPLHSSADDALS